MRTTMHKWEVERVKEIISGILQLWTYDSVSVSDESGSQLSMSSKTFLEHIERDLLDANK